MLVLLVVKMAFERGHLYFQQALLFRIVIYISNILHICSKIFFILGNKLNMGDCMRDSYIPAWSFA